LEELKGLEELEELKELKEYKGDAVRDAVGGTAGSDCQMIDFSINNNRCQTTVDPCLRLPVPNDKRGFGAAAVTEIGKAESVCRWLCSLYFVVVSEG
jgi:hypothetical protein